MSSGSGNETNPTDLAATVRQRLAVLTPQSLELNDDSERHAGHAGARAGGRHYRLRIISPCFTGLGRLARHRLVHEALGDLLHGPIHALGVQALTPAEVDPAKAADAA